MAKKNTQLVAVFTGDLVGSTNLTETQIDTAFEALIKCAEEAEKWHGASLQFTRHRGDGWQVILAKPKLALRTALYFRASLKALGAEFDTYIGGSIGEVETIASADLNTRNEDVFIQSGQVLESIKSWTHITTKMLIAPTLSEGASAVLADHIANDWTPVQAEVMSISLPPNTEFSYTKLANILKKSRQSVTKTLAAAGESSISIALDLLEAEDD